MDCVTEYGAAALACPFAAPGHCVIIGVAVPMSFQGGDQRFAGQPSLLQRGQLVKATAIAILENRSEQATRGFGRLQNAIRLGDAAGNRLFANHVFAGGEGFQRHWSVQMRRQANIDDVDGRVRDDLIDVRKYGAALCPSRQAPRLIRIEITYGGDTEMLRQRQIAVEMLRADSGAEDGDGQHHAPFRLPSLTAWACAFNASSITLKQCSWLIAVAVRLRTSLARSRK